MAKDITKIVEFGSSFVPVKSVYHLSESQSLKIVSISTRETHKCMDRWKLSQVDSVPNPHKFLENLKVASSTNKK